jgi:hypothetical protein
VSIRREENIFRCGQKVNEVDREKEVCGKKIFGQEER